jgi:hypothetical protein
MTAADLVLAFEQACFPLSGFQRPAYSEQLFARALALEVKTEQFTREQFQLLVASDARAMARWPVLHSLLAWLVSDEKKDQRLPGLPDWSLGGTQPYAPENNCLRCGNSRESTNDICGYCCGSPGCEVCS